MRKATTFGCFLGVMLCGAATAGAQQAGATPTVFGIHGGLSYTTLSGDGDASYRAGYAIGGYMDMKLSGAWSFQPELQYIVKGAKSTGQSGGVNFTADLKLPYVEVPVLLRYNGSTSSSGVTPFAQLGPEISFNTGCTGSSSAGGISASADCKTGGIDVETVDFGIIGGAGVDMRIGGRVFTGTVRYDLGLKNISSDGEAKNRAFTFLVGMRF